ncbi:hypothetical protein PsYK624_058750 [Phanerochaete sordida]|uniref:F-box domain-containing protein n=1 Tax=Phanerochaete sordida TaxID=48140 RepID=A0A9P3G7K4_9APHY|nr:hypothetical protein PsYK624_058750 [Phanerochaete sordida]
MRGMLTGCDLAVPAGAPLSREGEKKRAEDIADWPFRIPREIMGTILASPDLGVREHLALAATCCALRRMYHSNEVWAEIRRHRTVPVNGRYRRLSFTGGIYKDDRMLQHLATRPQKKKANGPFMKRLAEPYGGHYEAVKGVRHYVRIPPAVFP